nr:hypothetical protein 10 [Bacillales bacterium]
MNQLQKIFNYQGNNVRTVIKDGEPWFVAKDVCSILEIGNPSQALSRLDEDEKGLILNDTPSGKQQLSHVNEYGLYTLVLSSRKPEAKSFQRWITHEVIPSIRKTGSYNVSQIPTDLNAINNLLLASQGMLHQVMEINQKVQTVETDIKDVKQGMVDIDQPLRDQFNEAVRIFAREANINFNEAYNRIYNMLGKHHHVDIKRRVENRKARGQNVRAIDIVEELNLLVPAIRMAKVMASVS